MRRAQLLSLILHSAGILLLLHLSVPRRMAPERVRKSIQLVASFVKKNVLPASRDRDGGGGGGGQVERPASKGRPKQFVAPAIRNELRPVILHEVIDLPPDVHLPKLDVSGSPFALTGPFSPGGGKG